jgi:hypothetical protein
VEELASGEMLGVGTPLWNTKCLICTTYAMNTSLLWLCWSARAMVCLVDILNQGVLNDCMDRSKWKLTKDGNFTVGSMYKQLYSNGVDRSFRHLWKSKTPLEIKIWLWLIWYCYSYKI